MSLIEYALLAGGSLFAIVNPVAAVPGFLAMTPNDTVENRLRMARRACLTCAGVLVVFAAVGQRVFKILGISLPSFQIAGGLILLLVAMDSLRARRSAIQETVEEMAEGVAKADVSITPLAIPMLSGPGAITTVIVLESKALTLVQDAVLYGVILVVSVLSYIVFHVAVTGAQRVHTIAMNIAIRIMGLVLAATAIEFILGGLRAEGVFR
ncbi:MAG: NAAT family transporter [Elusimicrobia bacterium]|nr:NAAT family transporter [Elusimicrobiota bacterium]